MVDVHCHLFPGIDDGPQMLDAAIALARHAVAGGIGTSIVTPHIVPRRYENTLSGIREAAARFRAELAARQIPLAIGYAAEVRIGPEVMALAEEETLPLLGSAEGYGIVLLEFPDSHVLPGSDKLAAWLLGRNIRPMIAHPERNKEIMRDVDAIAPFVQIGCWLQLTAGSLTGVFGPRCRERSRQLLERGWVHLLASDAHDTPARMPELEPGRAAAAEIVGEEESWRLVRERPAAIAATNPGFAEAA
ncbi:MAG: capsular biosynthesis protein [Betaproteobacteria bacterium]|nr:capsular biosynthesis protein [Betaproteobacteria bacterium]